MRVTNDRPRDAGGRFVEALSVAQFEEFRKGLDHRIQNAEAAVMAARASIERLTEEHARAHVRQHQDDKEALKLARERVEADVDVLKSRIRPLEDANLVSATKGEVSALRTHADEELKSTKSGVNRATVAGVGAFVLAIIEIIRGVMS